MASGKFSKRSVRFFVWFFSVFRMLEKVRAVAPLVRTFLSEGLFGVAWSLCAIGRILDFRCLLYMYFFIFRSGASGIVKILFVFVWNAFSFGELAFGAAVPWRVAFFSPSEARWEALFPVIALRRGTLRSLTVVPSWESNLCIAVENS